MNKTIKELKKCCLGCGTPMIKIYARMYGKLTHIGWLCPICYQADHRYAVLFKDELAKPIATCKGTGKKVRK